MSGTKLAGLGWGDGLGRLLSCLRAQYIEMSCSREAVGEEEMGLGLNEYYGM